MENINNDGLEDIIEIWNGNGRAVAQTWLSTGKSFVYGGQASDIGNWGDGRQYLALDANKDGLVDIIEIWNGNGKAVAQTWLSTGKSFVYGGQASDIGNWGGQPFLALDANKDGLVDIVEIWNNNGRAETHTWLSTSKGFIDGGLQSSPIGHWGDGRQYLVLDADGESIQKILNNKIEKLENHKKGLHIAKAGQADRIIIEKDARIDPNSVIATELDQCKNIVHSFNPLEGDTIDLSQYGKFTVNQVSFATFQTIKTPTNQIPVSGVKINGEEEYVACVYGFDADKFFAPDYIDPYTGAPHMLSPHDVITLLQAQNFHGEL